MALHRETKFDLTRVTILGSALGGMSFQIAQQLPSVVNLAQQGAFPWLGAFVAAAGALSGVGFNRISSALDKKKEVQEATRDLLTNRDIALAQARAIEARLTKIVDEVEVEMTPAERKRLRAVAAAAPEWWTDLVSNPYKTALAGVRDDEIVGQITPYLTGEKRTILDAPLWRDLLDEAEWRTPGERSLREPTVAAIAKILAENFEHDFVEALKTDLLSGGKAYAAISLRFYGEILSGVQAIAKTQQEMEPLLREKLPTLLLKTEDAVAALRQAGELSSELDKALAATEARLRKDIGEILTGIEILLKDAALRREETKELRQELKEIRESLQRALARPVKEPSEFRADISRIVKYAPDELIGREAETALLDDAWLKAVQGDAGRPHILTFVALGGEGKTSLVARWASDLAHRDWPDAEAVFAWSFYSQGTREQVAASSDLFLREALLFFGDSETANSPQGAHEKGRRLAQLVGERRAILILDGLEPLQYAPTSPMRGKLKDGGMVTLLNGLAASNRGLCVVTTRYSVPDLRTFWNTTAPEKELRRLSTQAGVDLLHRLGVKGGTSKEFMDLVEEVKGHALTLNLLGTFLRDAHGGDIRRHDRVRLEEADQEETNGHAFRVMDAYVRWFESDERHGQRALVLLRLLGLFDRPADAGCLSTLLADPPILNLTEPLSATSEEIRNLVLNRLQEARLLTVSRDGDILVSLDTHPLVREYFARELQTHQAEAWRTAHRRLYKYLSTNTHDLPNPKLEDLQPLYQALSHGCLAEIPQEVYEKVLFTRIRRGGSKVYSLLRLGAYGSDLGAIACFFDSPWKQVSKRLSLDTKAWMFGEAGYCLRALGRLGEALEPLQTSINLSIQMRDWYNAATRTANLSESVLVLGDVADALIKIKTSVGYADKSLDKFKIMQTRATWANTLHQAGLVAESEKLFQEAERMQELREPLRPPLYSIQGFRYCDLLLRSSELVAWRLCLQIFWTPATSLLNACLSVAARAKRTLVWAKAGEYSILDVALDHLTIGRAELTKAILKGSSLEVCFTDLQSAVDGLHSAGDQESLPRGLLARAWFRSLTGNTTGPDSAQSDLDEAWEIAERGPMRLHMTDIHLYRARLFHSMTPYPWNRDEEGNSRGPKDDLKAARKLIERCGYRRRLQELEDAETAALNW